MLRGPGGGSEAVLVATGRPGHGPSHDFGAGKGRVAGIYGDAAGELVSALGGRPTRSWRRRGHASATEVATIPPGPGTVGMLLAAVASQFGHPAPARTAAMIADTIELGELRGRRLDDVSACDLRCLSVGAAVLTGAWFLVVARMDAGLGTREVAVVATALGRCASELGLGIVFGADATRNAFWADDVWHVGALSGAERVSSSVCAPPAPAATVAPWGGVVDYGF